MSRYNTSISLPYVLAIPVEISHLYIPHSRPKEPHESAFPKLASIHRSRQYRSRCVPELDGERASIPSELLVPDSLRQKKGYKAGINYKMSTTLVDRLRKEANLTQLTALRHPDPALVDSYSIKDPALQVRGVWKKLRVKMKGGPSARQAYGSAIWRGGSVYSSPLFVA